jgi:shikimate dehydrogenase
MKINGKTKLVGVFGNPIEHTASPAMHNAIFEDLDMNCVYLPILVPIDQIKEAVDGIRAQNFLGVNVTVPFKEAVIPHLDKLDKLAANIGAVNTIVNEKGCLTGYNTDGAGFIYSIKSEGGFEPKNKIVTILGAGGAAKAIVFSLIKEGINKLFICDIDKKKSKNLCDALNKVSAIASTVDINTQPQIEALKESDLVINASPIGMAPHENKTPITNFSWVCNKHLCYDAIYKPAKTLFLAQAEDQGAKILNGAGMLAGQGKIAFELFTGKNANFNLMKEQI